MHWGELIASFLNHFWPLPEKSRSPGDASSRLSDWAGWGLFAINLILALFVGFVFLMRLFGTC
jgi:hypothetical protein